MRSELNNILLRALPPSSFALLEQDLEPVALPCGIHLAEPGIKPAWVYFPETGVASIVGRLGNQEQTIGLFGQDGAGSLASLSDSAASPYLILMQASGTGHRVPASVLQRIFHDDAGLRRVLVSYLQFTLIQLAQNCLANGRFNTVERLAHWFLIIQDRLDGDSIALTHDQIASTLGVGRTGITLALHTLEDARLISIARKRVTILDRPGLETMTAGAYGVAEAEYRRRFTPPPPPPATG